MNQIRKVISNIVFLNKTMDTLASILEKKNIRRVEGRKLNENYERAKVFAEYVGVSVPFTLKLFKEYGTSKVLNLKSWLKDMNYDRSKGLAGLIIWKLKQK